MSGEKKNGKQDQKTQTIVLLTVVLQLINTLLVLVSRLIE